MEQLRRLANDAILWNRGFFPLLVLLLLLSSSVAGQTASEIRASNQYTESTLVPTSGSPVFIDVFVPAGGTGNHVRIHRVGGSIAVSLVQPNGAEITPANASQLGYEFLESGPSDQASTLSPLDSVMTANVSIIRFAANSPAGAYRVKAVGQNLAQEGGVTVLHFDAACLRYGVGESADAAQPAPMENRIIVLPDSAPVEILPVEPHFSVAEAALTGHADWWGTQLPEFLSNKAIYGEEVARTWHPYGMIVEFEALAPIALVHGYTSDIRYWNNAVADPDGETIEVAFMTPLVRDHVGFERISTGGSTRKSTGQKNIRPEEAAKVSHEIAQELGKLAKRHGADYVNVISHSLGAIWSRGALSDLSTNNSAASLPEIGVFNLITLAALHRGSVLGEIQHTLLQSPQSGGAYYATNYPWRLKMATKVGVGLGLAPFDETVRDTTTWKAEEYASRWQGISEYNVRGKLNKTGLWTLPTSFNQNENCDADGFDIVECDNPNECKRNKGFWPVSRRRVLQTRSKLIQSAEKVVLARPGEQFPENARLQCGHAYTPTGSGIVRACLVDETNIHSTPGCPNRKPLNDFTLRTSGMYFEPNFLTFSASIPEEARSAGGYLLRNHTDIAHSNIARGLMASILNSREQGKQRE
ncbi:MAG: hypothetical protein IT169_09805 [Bryobacterales bacterium]|nr:hypothetical protein [Bryobacterales bacterium]